jgi:hypothetical protein
MRSGGATCTDAHGRSLRLPPLHRARRALIPDLIPRPRPWQPDGPLQRVTTKRKSLPGSPAMPEGEPGVA